MNYEYHFLLQFQFQNGAIESIAFIMHRIADRLFQFQNGAIESNEIIASTDLDEIFQFQNGAIERIEEDAAFGYRTNFNSKMVRLRVFGFGAFFWNVREFQFQNGAIESISVAKKNYTDLSFQFQNGAIES